VVVVTANPALAHQMKQTFAETVLEDITVTSDLDFDNRQDCDVLIIDEADFVLDQSAIRFS